MNDTPALAISRHILNAASQSTQIDKKLFFSLLSRRESFDTKFFEATKLDPHPISDLGLRRSGEARIFFEGHSSQIISTDRNLKNLILQLNQHDFASLSLLRQLEESADNEKLYDFGQLFTTSDHAIPFLQRLMYYVNVLGSWEDGLAMADIVATRVQWLQRGNLPAYLLTCCANIYAVHCNPRCRDFYDLADNLYENTSQRFFNAFRSVVAELKRVGDEESTRLAFEKIRSQLELWLGYSISTQVFCEGIIDNLEALFYFRQRKIHQAQALIKSALKNLQSVSNDDIRLDPDVINRYRVQILENDALLSAHEGNWEESVEKMRKVVSFTKVYHQDSRGEAVSFLGYLLYRAKRYSEAYYILLEAEQLVIHEPRPSALLQIRQLLQGCALRMDRHDDAVFWATNSQSAFHDLNVTSPLSST